MDQDYLSSHDYYSTPDLALATTISLWYPIESIDRNTPTKAQFQFKRDDKLDQLIESYWKQELRIEPQAFFGQLKIIKSRLYGEK
mgnify:CR=1 FL=1